MRKFIRNLLATALLVSGWSSLAIASDGPYVLKNSKGQLEAWSVESTTDGERKTIDSLAPDARIEVPGVEDLPPFPVKLRAPAEVAADEVPLDAKSPVFVVADTHGEFSILAQMLMRHRVINAKLRWAFGRGHLVILGDVFDRGPHQTEILWLIYALEAEARKAGGGVHFVLGNHETMVLRGDLRYLNAKYRQTTHVMGVDSYARLFSADSVLGQWLRSRPTVLKIGNLLCVHGGISPELMARGLSLRQINDAVRAALDGREPAPGQEAATEQFVLGQAGPLWYRGYFAAESVGPVANRADIEQIRLYFGVEKILVGHTRVPAITPLYEGAVLAVQVYPRRDAAGATEFEALLIRGGDLFRAMPDGKVERLRM